ncbi:hypothetical protein [Nocardioides sp. zg-DK7169]|uniref:hypothetical protein n=1 Tax=Nocardioides sp. zg-DK7169 TaxID=2736600 RepID=UPI0015526FDF|nr:hypothetical protein [Nocardioides sp. zg-DK7169]NPC96489.1 hypothetical protein [Nocardioides sp. zg-DK7169]
MTSAPSPAPDAAAPADTGERLAAWLEELGLVEALRGAGLPTMTRDCHGRAVWTDPRTGAQLSAEQLADLDRQLHSEGSEPEHAVPVPLLQLAQRARVRGQLLASRWFTYESLAEQRGSSVDAARFSIHKAASQHRLLILTEAERVLVPAFQLDAEGQVRPELLPVLEPLLAARMDPWTAWGWLTRPAALLGGLVPEQAAADPDEAPLVLHAAVRLAEKVTAGS